MTQSEMHEQKVRLTLELQDAERHLNALRVSAEIHGETLIGLGAALRERPETVYRHGASAHYGQAPETFTVIEEKTVKALDIQKVIEETNEIRKEAENVRKIKDRLARLG